MKQVWPPWMVGIYACLALFLLYGSVLRLVHDQMAAGLTLLVIGAGLLWRCYRNLTAGQQPSPTAEHRP